MNPVQKSELVNSITVPKELNVSQTGGTAVVSQNHFTFFNKYFGFALSRIIAWSVETSLAEKVLQNPDLSMSEMALKFGYNSSAFNKLMRLMISKGFFTMNKNDGLMLTDLSKALLQWDLKEAILNDYKQNWQTYSVLRAHHLKDTSYFSEGAFFVDSVSQMVWKMAMGYKVSKAIYCAAELGLAERLSYRPMSTIELAGDLSLDPKMLGDLLNLLAKEGLLEQVSENIFSIGSMGLSLLEQGDKSLKSLVLLEGEHRWKALAEIQVSLKGEDTAFKKVYQKEYFEFLQSPENASIQTIFNDAMSQISEGENQELVSNIKFETNSVVMDVGGGQGKLLAALLKNNSSISGILFDLPSVVLVKDRLCVNSLGKRCQVAAGSFFESLPSADAYVLKRVIHDWNDLDALRILRRCADGMNPGGKVILAEMVMPTLPECEKADEKMQFLCIIDAYIMALLGGGERTLQEFEVLFEQAGLELTNIKVSDSYLTIMETKKKVLT